MSDTTAFPSTPISEPMRRLEVGLPKFFKVTAFVVGLIGVFIGLSILSSEGGALLGIGTLIGSVWSAVSIYAFGDIVLCLRKIAFNTEK